MVNSIIPKANTNKLPTKVTTVLEDLNLGDCRITQDEASHMKQGNGSMYALDIACIRGQSFDVLTPTIKNIYVIEHIGYDSRLGNYLILRHGNLKWLYGHTSTELNIGDSLKANQKLGRVDRSGISSNYHLHIELWLDDNNISFDYTKGKGLFINPKSFTLLQQRGLVHPAVINGIILEFISNYEGFRTTAYPDGRNPDGSQRYSIGKGTKSKAGATITYQEAEILSRIYIQYQKDRYQLDKYPLNVQIAVSSFVYNIGSLTPKQQWLLRNKYYTALGNDFKLYVNFTKPDGTREVLPGLVKRRNAEALLLTK